MGAIVSLTNAALQALLERRGYFWLSALVGIVPQFALDMSSFCQSGQPALPAFTATDASAMLNLAPFDELQVALGKIKDIGLYYVWYDLCDCVGGTTTPPASAQTPPDITSVGDLGSSPCLTGLSLDNPYVLPTIGDGYEITNMAWGTGAPNTPASGSDPSVTVRSITWGFTRERGASGTHEDPMEIHRIFTQRASGSPKLDTTIMVTGDTFSETIDVPTGYVEFRPGTHPSTTNAADTIHGHSTGFCYTLPSTQSSGCCPPDPRILSLLTQLQDAVAINKAAIDLVQRQAAPFGFIASTSHTLLTGSGSITVNDLVGVRIAVTAVPDRAGFTVGEPYEAYELGSIAWGSGLYYAPRVPIHHYLQLDFPFAAGAFTKIGYTLTPGVEITLTELVREP